MKTLAILLLLTAPLSAQIYRATFDTPANWQTPSGKFGTVTADPLNPANAVFTFTHRTSGTDSYSAAFDLSGQAGPLTLSFDFLSAATTNHALLVGVAYGNGEPLWLAGSPAAQSAVGFAQTFVGGTGWQHVTLDASAVLTAFGVADLRGARLTFEAWDAGLTSAAPTYLDNVTVSGASAIPEPSTFAFLAGAASVGLAVWGKRRRKA